MSALTKIIAPFSKTSYTIGGKSSGAPLPVEVTLKLDPDFKRTILKVGIIFTAGLALGVGAGVAVSRKRRY